MSIRINVNKCGEWSGRIFHRAMSSYNLLLYFHSCLSSPLEIRASAHIRTPHRWRFKFLQSLENSLNAISILFTNAKKNEPSDNQIPTALFRRPRIKNELNQRTQLKNKLRKYSINPNINLTENYHVRKVKQTKFNNGQKLEFIQQFITLEKRHR